MTECNCFTHRVEVTAVKELKMIVVTFWYSGHKHSSIWERLKMAWKVFRRQSAEFEEVWLDPDGAWKMAKELEDAGREVEDETN